MNEWLLTLCTFVPTAAALLLILIPRTTNANVFRGISLLACGVSLVLSLAIWAKASGAWYTVGPAADQYKLGHAAKPLEWHDIDDGKPDGGKPDSPSVAGKIWSPEAAALAAKLDVRIQDVSAGDDGKVTRKQVVDKVRELAVAKEGATSDRNPAGDFALVHKVEWIPAFNIYYFLGVDGLSLPLVLLTTLVAFLSMIASWHVVKAVKAYCILFLLLLTGMLGVFMALDFFLFYVFWEVMLLPMYFLIGIWGGPRREYAAIKFFLYTLFGSVLMLIAMLAFYFNSAGNSFDLTKLPAEAAHWTLTFQMVMFVLLFIGFAIKVPVFPFHTWLPDAHVEAPTPISMILAGVLLKMGGYGLFRISYPLCPQAAANDWIITGLATLGVINIVYGAFVALAQTDFKKLVAYSSVSHMGFVLLGLAVLTPMGMAGSMYQMLGHGISSAAMFFCVGILYERAHHRDLNRFGGVALQVPTYTGLAMVAFFASLGLPGLCGFPGEALTFFGSFPVKPILTCIAVSGVVLTAAYILWTIQRVYLGTIPGMPAADAHGHDAHGHDAHGHDSHSSDHGHAAPAHATDHGHGSHDEHDPHGRSAWAEVLGWEKGVLAVLGVFALLLGIFPQVMINMMNSQISDIINMVLPYAAR